MVAVVDSYTIGTPDEPWYECYYRNGQLVGIKYYKRGIRKRLRGKIKPSNNWLKLHGKPMRRTLNIKY